jgi:protein-disulfide isomerase
MENPPLISPELLPAKPENTITFKRTHLYALLIPLAFVVGLSVGYLFWGRSPAQMAVAGPQPQAVATDAIEAQQIKRYDVPEADNPAVGPVGAPITIIEFSDYQCPFCGKWYDEVWSRLKTDYAGKVRFVYRDFPLFSLHSEAGPAAEAAECAGDQNKYFEFHDLLFSNQNNLGQATYEKYASQIGLDMTRFKECLTTGKYKPEISSDYEFASNLGVNSTPTFFVNGIPVVGAQPYEVFKQLIDKELAGEIPKN